MFGFFIFYAVIDDTNFKARFRCLGEEGYVNPHKIRQRIILQHMLVVALLFAVLSLATLTACGAGSGQKDAATDESTATTVTPPNSGMADQSTINSFTASYDEYGLIKPNFFYSTYTDSFWSIQADVAENVWDLNFKTIVRVDIQKPVGSDMLSVGGKTFSIEDNAPYEKFPGSFLVLNGQKSTLRRVEAGTISFSPDSILSGYVNGAYDVMLTDYDSAISPTPHYRLMGTFSFKAGTYNAAIL